MINPTLHRVIVKIQEVEEVSTGGIVLAYENKERKEKGNDTGVITAIGPTAVKSGWDVGSKVMFDKYAGTVILINGSLHRLMNDEDIIAWMI